MSSEPVLINGIVAVLAALITPLLAKYGIDAEGAAKVANFVGVAIGAIVSVVALVNARSKVSPVQPVPMGSTAPAPPAVPAP